MSTPVARSEASALDPAVISRLGSLQLKARQVVEGVLSGLHRSPHRGQSVEFAEHKEYAPGDEVRHIDWKAYGKFDKYYVKQFEHETNLRAYLLVDCSRSMAYASQPGGVSKLDYAKVVAASLAYLLARQSDAVGLIAFGSKVRQYLPARASGTHLHELVDRLDALRPEGETDLAAAVDALSERARRRALVLVLTDLLDPEPESLKILRSLRHARHDVAVLHLMDRAEVDFPFEDPTLFVGMEDDRSLQVSPTQIRESYLEEVAAFIEQARQSLRESDVQYRQVITDEPYDRFLLDFLALRGGGRRGAR
ncbi:MAG: DUF58 domain-containing protein [Deltaproteobacteria bacterium]|nr:DUF58 domain-containing protein [Deltaproteobacteria bacterium]